MAARFHHDRRERGGVAPGIVAGLVLLGALAAAAAVIGPQVGRGQGAAQGESPARRDHRALVDNLVQIIGRSGAVLAIHQRGATPYLEIVLWISDDDASGRAEPDEVMVVSHSRVMRTVTVYEWAGGEAAPGRGLEVVGPGMPAFCEAWRADEHVQPRVILSGVSDLTAHPLKSPVAGRAPLEVTVTWAADSADGPDEVSAVVDAAVAAPAAWNNPGGARGSRR